MYAIPIRFRGTPGPLQPNRRYIVSDVKRLDTLAGPVFEATLVVTGLRRRYTSPAVTFDQPTNPRRNAR